VFLERFTIWIALLANLLAGLSYAYHKHEVLLYISFANTALLLIYVGYVRKVAKRLNTIPPESVSTGIHHIYGSDFKKLLEQKETVYQLVKAIDTIGDENQDTQLTSIQGEAGTAITNLQNKLHALKEKEKGRVWEAEGISSVSEIRTNDAELGEYAYLTICHLVKYLKANQGTFFIADDKQQLELLSTYAYGKRKHFSEKITVPFGTGLVGQCALERELMVMTDVPKDYVKITSGLGEATPRCVAIAPLLFREEVFGVIEIASFEKLEAYKLDFLIKACESIGQELSNVRSHERTRKVLEQSREEELRQNLEEMQATQREMLIKEEELNQQLLTTQRAMAMAEAERKKNEGILEGCMDAVISFNQHGVVEYFNRAAEEVFGIDRKLIVGGHVNAVLNIHIEENRDTSFRILNATGNEVTLRTEVNTMNNNTREEISLLLTATKVKIEEAYLFTLFAQKVSVELF